MKKRNKEKKSIQKLGPLLLWSGLLGLAVLSQPVLAQEQKVSLALDQTIFSLSADPGEEITLDLSVSNLLDKEQLVSLAIRDLSIEENNRLNLIVEKNELFGMKDWLQLESEKLILGAKETRSITVRIKIPSEATVGSHYAGVFFQALPEVTGENFQKVLVGAQIGTYVLLNVKGEVVGEGRINDFQAPILAKEKNALKVEFENVGNIHYIPHGEIKVKNVFLQKEDKIALEKHFVFPGKKYFFENNWAGGSSWGIYLAKAYFVDGDQMEHFSSRWIFGRYSFLWLIFIPGLAFGVKKTKDKFFSKKKKDEQAK